MSHVSLSFIVGTAALALFACSSSEDGASSKPQGPPIEASQVGEYCSGVGTSPGDAVAFESESCPAKLCAADARTAFDTYCTADCESNACPAGYTCESETLGDDARKICLKSGDAEPKASAPERTVETETSARRTEEEKALTVSPQVVPRVLLTGTFSRVDMEYRRIKQYMVLTMNGVGAFDEASGASVNIKDIAIEKTTGYELLYPTLGSCDAPPDLTVENGTITLDMQRVASAAASISGCYYLASFVRASDGGFQARLTNVRTKSGGVIKELLIEVLGPPRN